MTSTVKIDTEDGEMALYEAATESPARGGVVVLQEAFGVNDHIEDVCRRFATAGYLAVAPHLFHRSGDPVLDYSNIEGVMPHIAALSQRGLLGDLDAAIRHLGSVGGLEPPQIGVVGFCMGGTIAFLAATKFRVGAAVTFYGSGITQGRFEMPSLVELVPQLKAPWLGLFGDLDRGIPVEQVETLRRALADAPVQSEIVRYPEAEHGFHCDARSAYHETSAKDAWRRTLDWFSAHLS